MTEMNGPALAAPRIGAAGRRREIRIPVNLLATLCSPVREQACLIADLSRGGACCRAPASPPVGSAVDLKLDTLQVPAVVCWSNGGRIGLRFLKPLRASDILIQSSRSRSAEGSEAPLHAQAATRCLRRTC